MKDYRYKNQIDLLSQKTLRKIILLYVPSTVSIKKIVFDCKLLKN